MKKFNYSIDIFVIEDDSHDLELTLRAIMKCNPTIRTAVARDGVEALEYLFGVEHASDEMTKEIPRMIVIDLKLPRINGLEVIKKIKSHPRAKLIPIIVFSSSTQDDDIIEAYRYGANSYLAKPVKYEEYSHIICSMANYWLKQSQSAFL